MGSATDAVEIDILKMITGQVTTIFTTTPLTALWVRLTSTVPTDSAAGTEQTHADYDPVNSIGDWGTPSAGSVSNNAAISFGTATGTWDIIVGVELWTDQVGGTRIAWGELTTSQTPENGNPVSFPIGSLVLTLD